MKYLAIDTSGKALTIVINVDGKCQTFHDAECGINHSVNLMPRLEELIENCGVKICELDFIASVVGAGSFTGIRIGVSTVKALCLAYNIPAVSITSFDTIAYNVKDGNVQVSVGGKLYDAADVTNVYDDYYLLENGIGTESSTGNSTGSNTGNSTDKETRVI